jgi:hypothetical protein
MNKEITQLIDKYYKGETTLEEEHALKDILSSEEINNDDLYCRQMLLAFSGEKEEITPSSAKIFSPTLKKTRKFSSYYRKWLYAAAGMAACVAIFFSTFFYLHAQEHSAYVIINGVRINDEKLALQYIKENFEEEARIEKFAIAQLEEMNKIEDELNTIANNINNFNH